jgi:hypothetical protein
LGSSQSWLATLRRRAAKLHGRSFAELRERGGQALLAALEARGLTALTREPSDSTLRRLLDPAIGGDVSSAAALRDHFGGREQPAFFAGVRDGSSACCISGAQDRAAGDSQGSSASHTGIHYEERVDRSEVVVCYGLRHPDVSGSGG